MDEDFQPSDTLHPTKYAPLAATYGYNEMVFGQGAAGYVVTDTFEDAAAAPAQQAGQLARVVSMNRHIFSIVLSLVASVASGAIFLDSLFRQLALVEVAASLVTALQVFFLSSAIADVMEKREKASARRNSWVVVFTVFLIAFYSFTRYFQ